MAAVFIFGVISMPHVMNTYARLPVAFSHGSGCRITDTEGKEYLDALSGIAVSTLGHAHPELVAAISAQAGRMLHTSNLYAIREQEQLSDELAELSGMQEIFFCNSGCEANEAAIKLARFYGHKKGIELPTIIVMEKAFHGRTMATLSATGNRKAQAGFEPLVSGFVRVPYDDLDAIKAVATADAVTALTPASRGWEAYTFNIPGLGGLQQRLRGRVQQGEGVPGFADRAFRNVIGVGKARHLARYAAQAKARIAAEVERHVWPMVARGAFKVVIDSEYPLTEAPAAHWRLESSGHVGKIVMKVET